VFIRSDINRFVIVTLCGVILAGVFSGHIQSEQAGKKIPRHKVECDMKQYDINRV